MKSVNHRLEIFLHNYVCLLVEADLYSGSKGSLSVKCLNSGCRLISTCLVYVGELFVPLSGIG